MSVELFELTMLEPTMSVELFELAQPSDLISGNYPKAPKQP